MSGSVQRTGPAVMAMVAAALLAWLPGLARADATGIASNAGSIACPRDVRTVDLLVARLIGDESSAVRAAAATALGCSGNVRAIEPLVAAVTERDSLVRLAAVDAVAYFGHRRGYDGDLPLRLKSGRLMSGQVVSGSLSPGAAASGPRPSVDPNRPGASKLTGPGVGVVDALGQVVINAQAGDGTDDWSRGDAAWALGRLGGPEAVYYLSRALSDPDNLVRAEAARALIRRGDSRGLPVLAQHLADWLYGPRILLVLRSERWTPASDADQVHLWIARRDRARLVRAWSTTRVVLMSDLKSRFTLSALYAAIAIGEADFIPDATATLVTGGNRAMAEAFLNCGQPDLKQAAEAWAKARGYSILAGPEAPPVSWGEM